MTHNEIYLTTVEKSFERAFSQYVCLPCTTIASKLGYNSIFADYKSGKVFGGTKEGYRKEPDTAAITIKDGKPTGFKF